MVLTGDQRSSDNDRHHLAALHAQLKSTVRTLASAPDHQVAYLAEHGVGPVADELALELEDLIAVLPTLVEADLVTLQAADAVTKLDAMLRQMSNKAELWTQQALFESPEWQQIRVFAGFVADALDGRSDARAEQ